MTKHVYILNLEGMKGIKTACSQTNRLHFHEIVGSVDLFLDRRKNKLIADFLEIGQSSRTYTDPAIVHVTRFFFPTSMQDIRRYILFNAEHHDDFTIWYD